MKKVRLTRAAKNKFKAATIMSIKTGIKMREFEAEVVACSSNNVNRDLVVIA